MNKIYCVSLIVLSSLLLGGCGDSAWGNAKIVFQELMNKEKVIIKRETINNIPYATISASWKGGDPVVMVLGYIDPGNQLQWVDANNLNLITRYGRIVKTVGFESDIKETFFDGLDPLEVDPHLLQGIKKYVRTVVFGGEEPWQASLNCEMKRIGPERITIVELEFDTIRLEEKCKGVKWWTVKNTFWVDNENGLVWKSYQVLFENKPKLEINTLKPLG